MSASLSLTALLMGLAGGPHCAAMCGAACQGIVRVVRAPRAGREPYPTAMWQFQFGRMAGYCIAGACAAQAVQSVAWLITQTAALRPVWAFFHLAVLAWGLSLLVLARQPAWVGTAGRAVWLRLRPWASARGGALTAGVLWTFMPCGLLYSALLIASLSGGPLDGALSMALFAAGSGIGLALGPQMLSRLRQAGNGLGKDWGTRLSGLLLAAAAAWALWADLAHRVAQWCGLA